MLFPSSSAAFSPHSASIFHGTSRSTRAG
jgi:hypothetical protein